MAMVPCDFSFAALENVYSLSSRLRWYGCCSLNTCKSRVVEEDELSEGYIEFVLGSRYCDKSTPQKTKMA